MQNIKFDKIKEVETEILQNKLKNIGQQEEEIRKDRHRKSGKGKGFLLQA